jgi:hypothetical protein
MRRVIRSLAKMACSWQGGEFGCDSVLASGGARGFKASLQLDQLQAEFAGVLPETFPLRFALLTSLRRVRRRYAW